VKRHAHNGTPESDTPAAAPPAGLSMRSLNKRAHDNGSGRGHDDDGQAR